MLSAYNVEQYFFPSDGSQNVTSVPLKTVFVRGPWNFHFRVRIWVKYQWISSWVPLLQRPAIRNVFSLCSAIVVQVAETFGRVLFQRLSWNSKKKFRRSKKTDSSFPDVWFRLVFQISNLHFTTIQCWPVPTWHRSVDSKNGRRTMQPCSVFSVFIQLGKNKSWNVKSDQFPKKFWVLICQIHLLRYPAFQPNPYPEHCKTTWHPAASLCKVGLAPLRDCRPGSFILLTTDGCDGRLWATLWTLSKWKALV